MVFPYIFSLIVEEMSTWTVINFIDENTVEAVPSNWIKEHFCYWPPFLGDSLQIALKKCYPPKDNWNTHRFKTYKNGVFDDYLLARNKANKASRNEYSDLASDYSTTCEGRPKRTKKFKRLSFSEDSTESECDGQSDLPDPPQLSVRQNNGIAKDTPKRRKTHNENKDNQNQHASCVISAAADNTSSCSQVTGVAPPRSENTENIHLSDSGTGVDVVKRYTPLITSPNTPTNVYQRDYTTCRCCPEHPRKDGFFTQIIRKQNIIHATLLQLIEDVSLLKNPNTQIPDVDKISIFTSVDLPAHDKDTLDVLENYLGDAAQMNDAIMEVSKIGGCSPPEFMKRTMPRFLTDELAKDFNWLGKKKKQTFSNLNLSSLLLGALKKNIATSDTTEKDGETAMKKFLKGAKERAEKARK